MSSLKAYVEAHLEKVKREYSDTPQRIASDFNREKSVTEEYLGRQFFELIQNADDAAISAKKKHMYISLKEDKLIVANNGEPFTEQSYDSLFYSNISPKINRNLIGNKGLGFRSILSWANEITIHSGGVSVRFSNEVRKSFWADLKTNDRVRKTVLNLIKKGFNECPIAKLSVPQIIKQKNVNLPDYDTVIELSLKHDILEEANEQLKDIMQPEALLFFNNLTEIKIVNGGMETVIAREISNTTLAKEMTLKVSGEEYETPQIKTWYLLEHEYEITVDSDIKKVKISIAYSKELDDNVNYLYSFYRTNMRFTAPFIIHASFDLTQDRKNLIGNETNRLIFQKIAWFLCESAQKFADNKKLSPDFALRFVGINKGACDSTVEEMGFFEALKEELINAKIIPTVNNEFISFADYPVSLPSPIWSYFTGEDVSDLVNGEYSRSYWVLLDLLESEGSSYGIEYLCSLINKSIKQLDPVSIVELYEYIARKCGYPPRDISKFDPIRINTKKQLIDPSKKVFLFLDGKSDYDLPEEIEFDILDKEISEEIVKQGLEDRLKDCLNIHRYSFEEIANIIISHYQGSESSDDIKAFHKALYQVYQVALSNNENMSKVSVRNVMVSAKSKDIVLASSVYFGKEYGNDLTGTLFRKLPSKILGSPKQNGLEFVDQSKLRKYFEWLRVDKYPYFDESNRLEYDDDFIEYVFLNYDYKKYKFDELMYNSYSDFKEKGKPRRGWHSYWLLTIDGLDDILESITLETLLRWIIADPDLLDVLKDDCDERGELYVKLGLKRSRSVDPAGLKSYIRWRIANSPILQDSEDPSHLVPPNICSISKTMRPEYSPYIVKPKVDYKKLSKKLDLSKTRIDELLGYIGVHKSIETFSMKSIYQILLSLPEKDPDGIQAKAIYDEVLNYNENSLDVDNEFYKEFMEKGQVLCRTGSGKEYVPISEAFYLSENKYNESIQARFRLIDIYYKKGSQKVKKLFGVKPLGKVEIMLLEEPEINYLNEALQSYLYNIMPYAYAFVHSKDVNGKILEFLKNTEVILVDDVKAELIHNNIRDEVDLKIYEYIEVLERKAFYIKVDKEVLDFEFLINEYGFKDSISQIYASIIGAESDQMYRLFGESKSNWNKVLDGIFGIDYSEELIMAKEKLERQINEHFEFWDYFASQVLPEPEDISITNDEELRTYLEKTFNITDDQAWIWNSETYNRLDRSEVRTGFYNLFKNKDIDFSRLSRRYPQFNFRKDIERDLIEIKNANEPAFKASLYNYLKEKDIESKAKFLSTCIQYDTFIRKLEIPKYVQNPQGFFVEEISNIFGLQLTEEELDVNEIIKENLSKWSREVSFQIDEKIKQSKAINSLLLFGEFYAATEEAERITEEANANSSVRVAGNEIEYEQISDINAYLDEMLDKHKPKIIEAATTKAEIGKSRPSPRKQSNRIFESKNTKDIGYAAEYWAYRQLVDKYGKDSVEWVSENAVKARVNMEGRAGKGYDILLKIDGIERFVEVKAIRSSSLGFRMSKNELRTALDNPDKYDIFIVQSITESPEFLHIRSFFKIPKKQRLSNNDKFVIHLNSAMVKFNVK